MILILVGKSGSGKTAIQNMLINKYGYERVPTCTTRERREGEWKRAYHFMSREEFTERRQAGEFIEWDIYEQNLYGTLKSSLMGKGKLVSVMTPDGAKAVKEAFPDAFIVHVNPSTKTALLRAIAREEEIDPAKIHMISNRAMTDYYLFNDVQANCVVCNEGVLEDTVSSIVREHQKYMNEHEQ